MSISPSSFKSAAILDTIPSILVNPNKYLFKIQSMYLILSFYYESQ